MYSGFVAMMVDLVVSAVIASHDFFERHTREVAERLERANWNRCRVWLWGRETNTKGQKRQERRGKGPGLFRKRKEGDTV